LKLVVNAVAKRFRQQDKIVETLAQVHLEVKHGEFLCVVGPSGCGKSTLLNIIAGLEPMTSGEVLVQGQKIRGAGPDRLIMFQESALFPWLNVVENVEFGLRTAGVPKMQRREIALQYLRMVHLIRFQNCRVHQLSGGMKQRVALARALALNSDILLMDEPFASLDSQTRRILHDELLDIWSGTGKTIIFVTHNVEEAVFLADRVVVLSAHPGHVKKELVIDLARPRDLEQLNFRRLVTAVMRELKDEVEKTAREELESEWASQKTRILRPVNSRLGNHI